MASFLGVGEALTTLTGKHYGSIDHSLTCLDGSKLPCNMSEGKHSHRLTYSLPSCFPKNLEIFVEWPSF